MKDYFQTAKSYITAHKKETIELSVGAAVILAAIILIIVIVVLIQNSGPKIVYQPVKACDLFTPVEAETFLGDKILSTDANNPVISGNVATSKCSYTDENTDKDKMKVAAVAVRSGINDMGVEQNKTDFGTSKTGKTVEAVSSLGDQSYFNQAAGQLNILDKHSWIIISYGIGATPNANTLENAIKLAHKVLP